MARCESGESSEDDPQLNFLYASVIELQNANVPACKIAAPLLRVNGLLQLEESLCRMDFLVDGGASNCFLNPKAIPHRMKQLILEQHGQHSGSSGKFIIQHALATAPVSVIISDLDLTLGEWSGKQKFVVTDKIRENAIIGRDFLKQRAIVDHRSDTLIINEEPTAVFRSVKMDREVSVRPRHEHLLTVQLQDKFDFSTALFEPLQVHEPTKGVLWASSISIFDENNCVRVCLINATDHVITIRKGEEIGFVSCYEDNVITCGSAELQDQPTDESVIRNQRLEFPGHHRQKEE